MNTCVVFCRISFNHFTFSIRNLCFCSSVQSRHRHSAIGFSESRSMMCWNHVSYANLFFFGSRDILSVSRCQKLRQKSKQSFLGERHSFCVPLIRAAKTLSSENSRKRFAERQGKAQLLRRTRSTYRLHEMWNSFVRLPFASLPAPRRHHTMALT